jgi:putative ABC transport system substrate-binding protein
MTTADPLIASYGRPIVDFAAKHRLLSMYPGKEFADAGGLMFYGGSILEMYRRAALYIDKILKAPIPAISPSSNRATDQVRHGGQPYSKAAKALGLTIPPSLLLRADHVIE